MQIGHISEALMLVKLLARNREDRFKIMLPEAELLKNAIPLITKLSGSFTEPAKGIAIKTKERLEIKFHKGFSRFIQEQIERFSFVKTIISPSTPIPFSELYVNLFIQCKNVAKRDDDFLSLDRRYKSVLFTATAGSGKSMLMRYLFLKLLESQTDRLPIFIELRDLNHQPTISLREFVRHRIAQYIEGFSERQLTYAMESGKIVLLLDGFDEIDHDKRLGREKEIIELSSRFKENYVFTSSRPFESFTGWEKSYVFLVQPFTKKQVELLISKIPYDTTMKLSFSKKLSNGLFDTHKEFLRNPLLTVMMLITLELSPEIPAKLHLFYERAFDALYGRHDASKGGFQRKMHTNIALDDFKRLFSYFCALSYMKQQIVFSSTTLLDLIDKSLQSSQIKTDKQAFRNDLVESLCVIVADGQDFTFSHRSFQEYFMAYFLTRVKIDDYLRAVPLLANRALFDNVIYMLYDMNRERFEESWALPEMERLSTELGTIDAKIQPLEYCKVMIGNIKIEIKPTSMMFSMVPDLKSTVTRMVIMRVYGVFDYAQIKMKTINTNDEDLYDKIKTGVVCRDDPRFEVIRKNTISEIEGLTIEPLPGDSNWFRHSWFGTFIGIEGELFNKLVPEVKERVEARRRGLESIFDF